MKKKDTSKCGRREERSKQTKRTWRLLSHQGFEIESYDEELARKLIENKVIYEENLKVVYKSGLEVEIN